MTLKNRCPHCGEPVRFDAVSCWSCGSDRLTGWSEDRYMASIDLPNDFDYEKAVADEFGKSGATNNPRWWHSWKALVALLLLLLFIGGLLRGVAGPG